MIGPEAAHELAELHDAIRRAGYNVGTTRVIRLDNGRVVAHVDATSSATGETWVVEAAHEAEVLSELAAKLDIQPVPFE